MTKPLQRLALASIHVGCLGLLAVTAPAQTTKYAVTPAGHEFHPGNSNNTYPFSGVAAHYQQIHDGTDMASLNGGSVMIMTHIGFRPQGTRTIAARQWDLQITLSPTTVNAASMSTTFSANVTTTPTVVMPYIKTNAPTGTGTSTTVPNKVLWSFPFKQLFIYSPGPGKNLLWEWQSKNSTSASTFMDACSGTTSPAPRAANFGSGCTATGKSSPTQAQAIVSGGTGSLSLINAPASAQSLLWVGVRRTNITGPGWCSSLYVNPLLAVAGSTDSTGTWKVVSTASLKTTAYWEAFAQFGFADKGLVGGFGLSDMAVFAGPPNVGKYASRLWRLGGNGSENATTGSRGLNYAVVTIFTIK